jgi:PAS domain S-box-containing protein
VALENCRLYQETADLLSYTRGIINSLSGGFISTDQKGLVTQCNGAACRILGIPLEGVIGQSVAKALPQFPAFAAILEVTQKHQTPVMRQEIELQKPDGSAMMIGYSTFLIRGDSKILGTGIIFQDITHVKRA